MATRKPRRAATSTKSRARATRPARPAPRKPAARGKTRTQPERRQLRGRPESLRLRAIEPALTVDDIGKSVRFYTDVLGFFVAERWTEGGVLRGVRLKAGLCAIGLSQDDWKKGRVRTKGVGTSLWCQTVQDIDALAERIRKAGGQLTQGPKDESWGGRSLSLEDPDGFRMTIYREK